MPNGRRGHNPIGVEAAWDSIPQGSRDGNPGLEVETASRYLVLVTEEL